MWWINKTKSNSFRFIHAFFLNEILRFLWSFLCLLTSFRFLHLIQHLLSVQLRHCHPTQLSSFPYLDLIFNHNLTGVFEIIVGAGTTILILKLIIWSWHIEQIFCVVVLQNSLTVEILQNFLFFLVSPDPHLSLKTFFKH